MQLGAGWRQSRPADAVRRSCLGPSESRDLIGGLAIIAKLAVPPTAP